MDLKQTEHQYGNNLNGFTINYDVFLRSQTFAVLHVCRLAIG